MKNINVDSSEAVQLAVDAMKRGEVVILPTDTLYGFSAALGSRDAFERIIQLKRGVDDRRFVHLAASLEMVERYVKDWGTTTRDNLSRIWPAALTAVLPAAHCPDWVGKSVAFRVPEYEPVRRIIEELGEPILSTSVNRARQTPLGDADAIEVEFGAEIELMFSRRNGAGGPASTLVDFTASPPRVLRHGGYPWPDNA
jgi:L-threonylcarbamoyladenylate synthase